MEEPVAVIKEMYGNQVRVRVCGLYLREDKILLVNHALYGAGTNFWSPPGGGVLFGESVHQAMAREFKEETGGEAQVGSLLFVHEFIQSPLHALEFFLKIEEVKGSIELGSDPEFSKEQQIIQEVSYLSLDELNLIPNQNKHAVLAGLTSFDDLLSQSGLVGGR